MVLYHCSDCGRMLSTARTLWGCQFSRVCSGGRGTHGLKVVLPALWGLVMVWRPLSRSFRRDRYDVSSLSSVPALTQEATRSYPGRAHVSEQLLRCILLHLVASRALRSLTGCCGGVPNDEEIHLKEGRQAVPLNLDRNLKSR